MADKIIFNLDGNSVEAEPGETIWEVAKKQGTTIPHLCHSGKKGYRSDGNCRACMVEIDGGRLMAICDNSTMPLYHSTRNLNSINFKFQALKTNSILKV